MIVVAFIVLVVVCFVVRWLLSLPSVGHYDDKYVFITGCDTGFGNLLAKRLDNMGFHVFAACYTSQGADDLEKVSSERLMTISTLDISDEDSIEQAHRVVVDHLPSDKGLWAIVNNAGGGGIGMGPMEWHTRDVYLDICAVNLFGMIDVTKIFLPLIRKGHGRIVNMSSYAGRAAAPFVGPYTISKFGVEGFSDCLRLELYKEGISVHIIEPGGFRTQIINFPKIRELVEFSFNRTSPEMKIFYGETYPDQCLKRFEKNLNFMLCDDLHLVIDSYVHAITAKYPKTRYAPGNWLSTILKVLYWMPTSISDWIYSRSVILPQKHGNTGNVS